MGKGVRHMHNLRDTDLYNNFCNRQKRIQQVQYIYIYVSMKPSANNLDFMCEIEMMKIDFNHFIMCKKAPMKLTHYFIQ